MLGTQWRVKGSLWNAFVPGHHVWDLETRDVITTVTVNPELFKFPVGGVTRHASLWLNQESFTLTHHWRLPENKIGDVIDEDNLTELGLDQRTASLRAIITPFKSKRSKARMEAKVVLVILPSNTEDIRAKATEWNANMDAYDVLPTIALKDFNSSHRGKRIPMGLEEPMEWNMKMGIIPILECRTQEQAFNYPSRDAIAREIQGFTKDWPQINIVQARAGSLEEIYEREDLYVGNMEFMTEMDWPWITTPAAEGKSNSHLSI